MFRTAWSKAAVTAEISTTEIPRLARPAQRQIAAFEAAPKHRTGPTPWLRTRSMPVSMTGNIDRVEVITSVQRRRRWSAEEKARIVQETFAPGMSVSLVARQHGVAPNQLFTWRRLYAEGALLAVGAGEEVVPTSEYRALQYQVRELQRLLGKKTLENEILREALELAQPKKRLLRSPSPARDGTPSPRGTARRAG